MLFQYRPKNFIIKFVGMWKFFLQKTDKRISYQEFEKLTLNDFLLKLRTTDSTEHTVMIDFKICCLYVALVLPGSVETQLGWSGKFC